MERGLTLCLIVMFMAGCSSKERETCEPGDQQECTCTGEELGFQVCKEDGSGWQACDCSCTPDCTGLDCGPDPECGLSCGECEANETCNALGQCIGDCVPDCTGRECGADPVCGLSCGECAADEFCSGDGVCLETGELTLVGWTPLANAEVAAAVGRPMYSTTADANGNYQLTIPTGLPDSMVMVFAFGAESEGQGFAGLASLLGDMGRLQELAGFDRQLTRDEHQGVNITPMTTAHYTALTEANGGWEPFDRERYIQAEQSINSVIGVREMVDFAGVIELIIHSPDYSLPAGFDSTLDLARDHSALRAFVERAGEENVAENPCREAAAAMFVDGMISGAFSADDLPSSYYDVVRHRNGFIGTAQDRYDFNSNGRGVWQPVLYDELRDLMAFDWVVEGGLLRLTFDVPLADYLYLGAEEIVELLPGEPVLHQQIWEALGSDGIVEVRTEDIGRTFLLAHEGETVDCVWPSVERIVYLSEALAEHGVDAPDVEEVRPEDPHAWFRHEGLVLKPLTSDLLDGIWAMQLILPLDRPLIFGEVVEGTPIVTHALVAFQANGSATASGGVIVGTLDLTWEILGDGNLQLTYPEGQVQTVGLWHQEGAEHGFLLWYRPLGEVVYTAYARAARLDPTLTINPQLLRNAQGEYWQTTMGRASYLLDSQGNLPLDDCFGFHFADGGALTRLFVDYLDPDYIEPYVYMDEEWLYQVSAQENVMEVRYDNTRQARCAYVDPSCFPFRRRIWTPVALVDDLLYVVEEDTWLAAWMDYWMDMMHWDEGLQAWLDMNGEVVDPEERRYLIPLRLNAYYKAPIPTFP